MYVRYFSLSYIILVFSGGVRVRVGGPGGRWAHKSDHNFLVVGFLYSIAVSPSRNPARPCERLRLGDGPHGACGNMGGPRKTKNTRAYDAPHHPKANTHQDHAKQHKVNTRTATLKNASLKKNAGSTNPVRDNSKTLNILMIQMLQYRLHN